ncbi:hypothetical protein GC167_05745 [bacterium]|nr:hypothetical protein [bacterium]
MKHFITLVLFAAFLGVSAQNYTDCAGNSENLQQWLSAGTPVLVASKGVDCSICMSSAPQVGTWATNNPQVRVWAAMTYRYSTQDANCTQVNNWVNSYGWGDVFAFADVNEDFRGSFFSRYLVYALDGSVAYDGPNLTTAGNTALGLVSGVGLEEANAKAFSVFRGEGVLEVAGIQAGQTVSYELIDLAGRSVIKGPLTANDNRIAISGLKGGIHLVRLGQEAHKVVL